ncbi:MAG: hypothetical protein ABIM19_05190 [candidate division WOR-3 bacterium]
MSMWVCLFLGFGDAFVWGTSLDDEIRAGVAFGGRILGLGRSYSTSADGHMLIWDRQGNLLDALATGIMGTDEFFGACREGDSVVAVGFTSALGNSDGLVVRSDSFGNPAWILAIGGDMAECFEATDGGYVAGYTSSWGSGETDVFLLRMRAGAVVWAKAIGGGAFDYAKDIAVVNDTAILVGYTESYGQLGDAMVMRVDSFGNLIWCKVFGGSGYDTGQRLVVVRDTIIIAGRDGSNGGGILVFALDLAGNLLWARLVRATGYEFPLAISADDRAIYIGGKHTVGGPGFLIKLLTDGSLVWGRYIGGNSSDGIGALIVDEALITSLGYTSSFGSGRKDFLFASVDHGGYNCVAREAEFLSYEIPLSSRDATPSIFALNPSIASIEDLSFSPTLEYSLWCEGIGVAELPAARVNWSGIYDCAGRFIGCQPKAPGVYFQVFPDGRVRRLLMR